MCRCTHTYTIHYLKPYNKGNTKMTSLVNFQTFKEENNADYMHTLLQTSKRRNTSQLYKSSKTLILKPDKNLTRKENDRQSIS